MRTNNKNDINTFEFIRENLDIIEVSKMYGMNINKHKKTLCLYHSEETASLSFKNNRFFCFGCGATGTIVDIVMKLFNLSPLEAVKKLNCA